MVKVEFPEFTHHADTLLAVAIGAVLATIGGFVATLVEQRLQRREREKTAALAFGEILASLRVLLRAVEDTRQIGDPFGPVTMRILRGARREVDAYDRSRPALSDLRDPDLRIALHSLMTRFALAIDGVLETAKPQDRTNAYGYLVSLTPGIDTLVSKLAPVSGQSLKALEGMASTPEDPSAGAAASPSAP